MTCWRIDARDIEDYLSGAGVLSNRFSCVLFVARVRAFVGAASAAIARCRCGIAAKAAPTDERSHHVVIANFDNSSILKRPADMGVTLVYA